MSTILQGLPNVTNCLGDIFVWGNTFDAHEHFLQAVLHHLQDIGLQLKESKCHYRRISLWCLGHIVTAQGIQPDKDNLSTIVCAHPPSEPAKLHSFLGRSHGTVNTFFTMVEPVCHGIRVLLGRGGAEQPLQSKTLSGGQPILGFL